MSDDERRQLYATMLAAHTDHFSEPADEHRRYLWGLAAELAEREGLALRWGVKAEGAALPTRELNDKRLAEDALERAPVTSHLVSRWESRWQRVE
ncbi:hypothetical protein [Nesterenkonia populi]|uniref:hypothetical protein n=1 Tax=Nesterenkonia populi TaxID=1591087 RepID=UPI0011BDEA7B|nr:hypothetical protein [Nesterenkonia populi]